MTFSFRKFQALGNDFIVTEAASLETFDGPRAKQLCDRRRGIGGDGLLLVLPSSSAAARMVVLNADGSRPEMCGNGLRCVARYLASYRGAGTHFDVETDAGRLRCVLTPEGDSTWVQTDIGPAAELPRLNTDAGGVQRSFQRISVGNPHAVAFGDLVSEAHAELVGPVVSGQIDGGANVEFVLRRGKTDYQVVVWERGVGLTLACGTGAGAVGAAAVLQGLAPYDAPLNIELPGGALQVTVAKDGNRVTLRGPAEEVFAGRLD